MTPHIFRKYAGYNQNDIKCWSLSKQINTESFDLEDIVLSSGSSKAGTSIPSPLARIELFDTAFHIVSSTQKDNLVGKTIYHQLVSDCLDVFQLMFNSKNKEIGPGKTIWFKEWNVNENIDWLMREGEQHPNFLLGKALKQIFKDKSNPAFYDTSSIFLIFYGKHLLGGTSPLTMFFTTPNWSRYVAEGEVVNRPQSADGKLFFDHNYRALHERDREFIKYVYKLAQENSATLKQMKGFRIYLDESKKKLDWKHELDNDTSTLEEEYSKIQTNVDGKFLTINGIFFYHQQEGKEKEKIERVSDFKIRASHTRYQIQYNDKNEPQHIHPPLVLLDKMNMQGDYMEKNAPWNPSTIIKDIYHHDRPLYMRFLPQGTSLSNVQYPFVTTDDFLESTLMEMPFPLNADKFFTGFDGDFRYLLPVKKEYFNFFDINDLKKNLHITIDGKKIKVQLKVPIISKKGIPEIVFSREYDHAKGQVIECKAGIGMYPFYKVAPGLSEFNYLNDFTVLLANRVEADHSRPEMDLKFYDYNSLAGKHSSIPVKLVPRSVYDQNGASATSKYYRIKQAFDYMEFSFRYNTAGNECAGLIIPDFNNRIFNGGTKKFAFSIDFGTSNTHVAWMDQGEQAQPQPFEITEADHQMVLLSKPSNDPDTDKKFTTSYGAFPAIDSVLRREFIPSVITSKSNDGIAFPIKTASCELEGFDAISDKSGADLFTHVNIGYYIDKEASAGNVVYTTNLKWLLENNFNNTNSYRVRFFIKQILQQIKVKAVLNNGNVNALKLVWSIPSSMSRRNRSMLEDIMKSTFSEVFNGRDENLMNPIPESVAPYFYLTRAIGDIKDTANVVNLDIGGGTTDIMMFMEGSQSRADKYLTTSFRFAGNDLWGSGFNGKMKDNGFIRNYLRYKKENSIHPDEVKFFSKVENDPNLKSDDVISLLFKYNDKFKFTDSITLDNPGLSIILYLHYSSIVYHLMQLIELKQYSMPRYLSFTGKGSQYLKLLCGGSNKMLTDFTRLLVKEYTGKELEPSFSIHLNSNPKEITANGALIFALTDARTRAEYERDFQFIHPGFDPATHTAMAERVNNKEEAAFVLREMAAIDTPLNEAVLSNINNFLEKTLGTRTIIDFLNEFEIRNLKQVLDEMKWNGNIENGSGLVYDSYRKVLNEFKHQDMENKLPESLFFFAFKDALYHLSKTLA
ncbi:MAG: hypothetical protein ACO1NW_15140 [Chitinophagaceae bacterium]